MNLQLLGWLITPYRLPYRLLRGVSELQATSLVQTPAPYLLGNGLSKVGLNVVHMPRVTK